MAIYPFFPISRWHLLGLTILIRSFLLSRPRHSLLPILLASWSLIAIYQKSTSVPDADPSFFSDSGRSLSISRVCRSSLPLALLLKDAKNTPRLFLILHYLLASRSL